MRGWSRDLDRLEKALVDLRGLAANAIRWKSNLEIALKRLGIEPRERPGAELVAYLQDVAEQLQVEADRFEPLADRANAEIERDGGLLGWPGVALGAAALAITFVQTWWTIIAPFVIPKAQLQFVETLARWSFASISLALALTAGVLLVLGGQCLWVSFHRAEEAGKSPVRSMLLTRRAWAWLVPALLMLIVSGYSFFCALKALQ